MRTIKVEIDQNVGNGGTLHISTEAVVNDDSEAYEAGVASSQVVTDFVRGYGEAQDG